MRVLVLTLLLVACGGTQADKDLGAGVTDGGIEAQLSDVAAQDLPEGETAPEPEIAQAPPEPPLPVDPLPEVGPGTFVWTDSKNRITLAYNDGKVFVLESSFTCVGKTGCKVQQEFLKLTCNKAFEKGYVADVVDGVFEIHGIKGSDTLYGAVTSSQSFALLYVMTPAVSCCEAWFDFSVGWNSEEDCSDYAVPDCDPYTDANCQEGMNCIFGANDKPVCMVAGETLAGNECSMQGNCMDGVCMGLEGVEGQYCYKYCKSANDCAWGSKCLEIVGHQWKICSLASDQFETCNLLTQNCKKPTDGCYWSDSTINDPICMPAGQGEAGDDCANANDCKKGYDCIANKECRKLCNLQEGYEPSCDSTFVGCSKHYPMQQAGYCGE